MKKRGEDWVLISLNIFLKRLRVGANYGRISIKIEAHGADIFFFLIFFLNFNSSIGNYTVLY